MRYNLNKPIYNQEASEYIRLYLSIIGSFAHAPHVWMTYYIRRVVEKLDNNLYQFFDAELDKIEYGDGRDILSYSGNRLNIRIRTRSETIESFGFDISSNPRSKANRMINISNKQ